MNDQDYPVAKVYMEDREKYDQNAKEWTDQYAQKELLTDNERLLSKLAEQFDLSEVVDTVLRTNWNEKRINEILKKQ